MYADISISPAAFVEPYGVSGFSVAASVIAGASIGPVTAFVEANASALTPARARRLQQRRGRCDVRPVGQLRLLERAQHRGHGREVHDRVEAAFEARLEHVRLGDVALDDLDVRVGMRLQVDDADVGAGGGELGDHVAADEARTAGDQDPLPAHGPPTCEALTLRRARCEVWGSSLEVSAQRTVGMIAATSTRSGSARPPPNRWSISVVDSSVGFSPRPSSAV